MASNDGTIAFDSSINTDNLNRDLSEMEEAISNAATASEEKAEAAFENMEKQAKRLAKAYEEAGMDASEALQKAWKDVQANADAFGTNATENFRNVGAAAEDAGASIEDLSEKLKNALAAVGLSYGAKEITDVGISYEKAMNQVAISTGATGQELENLQEISSNIYADGLGESMEDVASGVSEVYNRTGLVGEELQKVTEDAYTLQNAFGYEVNDSLQAATQLMNTFGISAEEAYTLIAQGAQKGLDQNGDMLDTLNEYSVQFANLGYSAEDMFNMLANGVESGTWSVDKLGDAVKEVNIRLNDGTADEALQALGLGFSESATDAEAMEQAALNVSKAEVDLAEAQEAVNTALSESGSGSLEYQDALNKAEQAQMDLKQAQEDYNTTVAATSYNLDDIKGKLAAGGTEAQSAMQEIMTALYNVEDEQERYTLGQQLMGTMWEDLGEDAVKALMDTQGEISTTSDAMEKISGFNDLGDQLEGLKRQVETEVVLPITQKYMPKIEKAIDYVAEHLDEIIQYATPIAAALASAFAVTKIVEFGTTAVNTIKTVKTAFMALNTSNPLGWITLGITAVTGAITALVSYSKKKSQEWKDHLEDVRDAAAEIPDEIQESIDKTDECSQAWDSMKENMKSSASSESYDYESVTKLKDSLEGLINADGTIKTGAEEKVSTIIDQLNQYSDTGLSVSDGIIEKNGEVVTSYDQISDSIDNVIEKQHAQNLASIAESGYQEAMENRQQLLDNEVKYADEVEKTEEKIASAQKAIDEIYKIHGMGTDENGNLIFDAEGTNLLGELPEQLEGYKTKLDELKTAREDNNKLLQDSLNYESQYNEMQEELINGDYAGVQETFSKLQSGFVTASTGSIDELRQQVSDFKAEYESLQKTAEEHPGLVSEEQLASAKQLWEDAKTELALATTETGTQSGADLMENLQNSALSNSDKIEAINQFVTDRLKAGMNLDEIADELGLEFDSGLGESVTSGTAFEEALDGLQTTAYNKCHVVGEQMGQGTIDGLQAIGVEIANSAANVVADAISRMEAAAQIHSPSKVTRDKVGKMLGAGVAVGLEQSEPEVERASTDNIQAAIAASEAALYSGQISASFADAAVPETLGLMDAKVRSSVSAYNPVFTQVAATANRPEPVQPVTNSSSDSNLRDIVIPVQIGDETLDTIVVNAIARANASSGGWSV